MQVSQEITSGETSNENFFAVIFEEQSEAYQAFDEMKAHINDKKNYVIPRMVLVEKSEGKLNICEGCDARCRVTSTALGSLFGMVVGLLGGPLGVVLGGAAGGFISNKIVSSYIKEAMTELENVGRGIQDGEIALIALVQENQDGSFEKEFAKYKTAILKKDAAQVAVEVEDALELNEKLDEMEKERECHDKMDAFKEKLTRRRKRLKSEFKTLRESL